MKVIFEKEMVENTPHDTEMRYGFKFSTPGMDMWHGSQAASQSYVT